MTSKEALKSICLECEREKGKNKIACPFRSISNEYCEEYDTIKKDLERLESLEKQNELLKKDLKEYQAYIKKGVEEHYKDFMSDYDLLLQECQELNKRLEVLEIIKKSITHKENHKYVLNEKLKGQKFMTMNLYIFRNSKKDRSLRRPAFLLYCICSVLHRYSVFTSCYSSVEESAADSSVCVSSVSAVAEASV